MLRIIAYIKLGVYLFHSRYRFNSNWQIIIRWAHVQYNRVEVLHVHVFCRLSLTAYGLYPWMILWIEVSEAHR